MRFFRFVGRLLTGLVRAIQVVFFLVFVAIVIGVVAGLGGAVVQVPDKAALVVAPSGLLVEQAEGEVLDQALLDLQGAAPGQTVVREVVDALRLAADDDRIQAVVLLPDFLAGGGLSKLQTIGRALDEFRATGKPVIAMGSGFDQNQYYLAAHADEIYMHDFGLVLFEGYGYFRAYFADAIDKLNIDVNVFRVGKYKSFVEPYLRNSMSADDREASERWVESLWTAWRRDVSEARGLAQAALDNYVTQLVPALESAGGDAGRAAVDAGLVDGLRSFTEFRDYVAGIVGRNEDATDSYSHIDFREYLLARDFETREERSRERNVGVIVASGAIVDGEAPPGTIGSDTLARLIRDAAADSRLDAVVLQVDSPGGSMFASEVIVDELQALRESGKPLVASMSSVAASGGYYISMPADQIWAAETTISGSIGVGAIFPTFQRSLGSLGVTVDGFGTTEWTGQFSGLRELGPEGRRLLEVSTRSAYDVFVGKVAEAREMSVDKVEDIARGRVWTGADAREIGLVDEVGGLEQALDAAAELAGLPADSWGVVYVRKPMSIAEKLLLQYASFLEQLAVRIGWDAPRLPAALRATMDDLAGQLDTLEAWNDPRGIYLHCFCVVR